MMRQRLTEAFLEKINLVTGSCCMIDKPVSLEAYDSKFSAQLRTLPPRATPPEPQQTDHRVRKTLSFNQVIADLRTR